MADDAPTTTIPVVLGLIGWWVVDIPIVHTGT